MTDQHKTTPEPAPCPVNASLPEHLRWRGEGPPPPRWTAPCGTIVYRSYADYCDD